MSSTSRHDRVDADFDADVALPTADAGDAAGAPAAIESHPKAVKTFVFEVTAGRPKGVGDATTGRTLRVDAPRPAPIDFELAGDDAGIESDGEHVAAGDEAVLPVGAEPWPVAVGTKARRTRRSNARQPRRRARLAPVGSAKSTETAISKRPRRLSAWSVSFVVHGLMLAAISLITITQAVRPNAMDLVMASPPNDVLDVSEISDPNAEPSENADAEASLEEFSGAESEALIDPGLPTLGMEAGAGAIGELTDEMALVGGGGGGEADGPFGGLGGSGGGFGNGTGGSAEFGEGRGGSPTAEFFGAKIDGNRIVFVLDNSGSMQGGRLETVIAELLRSVESLTPKQTFYVVFYSDMAYPLFYPDPAQEFIRPTDDNKADLARWLDTVELCLGDAVQEALAGAISIEPDSVILLGDGRIQGEKKMRFLLEAGGGEFPIHTVGVGLGKNAVASRRNLQMIAEANGGEFREAEVPQEMRELALTNPRPYHNKGPGPVWGLKVKAWGSR